MKFIGILIITVATVCANADVMRHGGGFGGGHNRCRIVANGTTTCFGTTGTRCQNATALTVSQWSLSVA
jgi:hypothetical protein